MGREFFFKYVYDVVPNRKQTYGPPRPVTRIDFNFLYYMMFYLTGNTLIYLHGLLQRYRFSFYMKMIFVPHRKHPHTLPRPVRGVDFLFLYIDDVCTSQENTHRPPRPVTEIAFLFYMTMMFVRHRKHT
jgi:hypothetical protein